MHLKQKTILTMQIIIQFWLEFGDWLGGRGGVFNIYVSFFFCFLFFSFLCYSRFKSLDSWKGVRRGHLENAGHIRSRLGVGGCGLGGSVDVLVAALLAGGEDRARLEAAASRIELPVEQGHAHRSQDQVNNAKRHGPAIWNWIIIGIIN